MIDVGSGEFGLTGSLTERAIMTTNDCRTLQECSFLIWEMAEAWAAFRAAYLEISDRLEGAQCASAQHFFPDDPR